MAARPGIEPDAEKSKLSVTETMLYSIAISLRRIADKMWQDKI